MGQLLEVDPVNSDDHVLRGRNRFQELLVSAWDVAFAVVMEINTVISTKTTNITSILSLY